MAPGNPHEASVTDNVIAAYDFAVTALHWDPKNIILFGRSIGTGMSMSGPLSLCLCACIRVFVCIAEVFLLVSAHTFSNHTNLLIHTYKGPAVKLCAELDCGGLILVSPYTAVKDMVIVCISIPIWNVSLYSAHRQCVLCRKYSLISAACECMSHYTAVKNMLIVRIRMRAFTLCACVWI